MTKWIVVSSAASKRVWVSIVYTSQNASLLCTHTIFVHKSLQTTYFWMKGLATNQKHGVSYTINLLTRKNSQSAYLHYLLLYACFLFLSRHQILQIVVRLTTRVCSLTYFLPCVGRVTLEDFQAWEHTRKVESAWYDSWLWYVPASSKLKMRWWLHSVHLYKAVLQHTW